MKLSDQTNELAIALAKAQGAMQSAVKDAKGNFNKYATLASIWDVARAPLSENALAVVQCPETDAGGVTVTLRLMHSSGQWLETALHMPVAKQDAHGMGSGISYACRYQLKSVLGIAADDDDGAGAVEDSKPDTKTQQTRPASSQPQQGKPKPSSGQTGPVSPATAQNAQATKPAVAPQAIQAEQVEAIKTLRELILATNKLNEPDWRAFMAFSLQDVTLLEPKERPNYAQGVAFIGRFGKVNPDGALVLDHDGLTKCLSDWDEALEADRAAKAMSAAGADVEQPPFDIPDEVAANVAANDAAFNKLGAAS